MKRTALFEAGLALTGALAFSGCAKDVAEPLPGKFEHVMVGVLHSCGLMPDGTAFCWGNNDYGQLGDGSHKTRVYPVPVVGSVKFAVLTLGGGHTCGIAFTGGTYCWGRNLSGQLGDGTHIDRATPSLVSGNLSFVTLAAAGAYTCGIAADGTAYCWGWDQYSQLGDNATVDQAAPKAVAGTVKFASISGNAFHTCAVTAAGAAYCWGTNDFGQLGTGNRTASAVPVAVTGGLSFASVRAGYHHTCGVTLGGAAYCWGRNHAGQLGVGEDSLGVDQTAPYAVDGGLTWSLISSGAYFTCGVEGPAGGAAYCWGTDQAGQLGATPATTCVDEVGVPYYCAASPLAVGGGLAFAEVSASTQHVCGLTLDGIAYCWGAGTSGELGDGRKGTNVFAQDPVKVGGQP